MYGPGIVPGKRKNPTSFDVVRETVFVFLLVSVTEAPGMTAPDVSTTVPVSEDEAPWASADAANDSARREMTKRAALADAQRNLLRIIEQLRINTDQDVKTAMRGKKFASKIQGFIKGYTVVSERDLEGGRIEVVLELPLTGPGGLSRYLTEGP